MSNTLNTPIEALELEYPMRVERYELAEGSGGGGRHRGGDGVVRSIRVLEPATVSLRLTGSGIVRAGAAAASRAPLVATCSGREPGRRSTPPKTTLRLAAGEMVTVVTPGGGGWGAR